MRTKFNGILTLLLALTVQFTFAQKTVSGTVSDENGPLPGVNILVKGTKTGTETDFDGKYSLKAKQGDVLVFSFVGMQPVEKTIGTGSVIDVKMTSGNTMEEIVITALGIPKKVKALGYDSQGVKGDVVSETKESNLVNSLTGKVAGVQITNSSGAVGSSTRMVLRGGSSIYGDSQPLFIVDGMPVSNANNGTAGNSGGFDTPNAVSDINPDDIENVEILKGAAASALYGIRAANGVVVITTKKGKLNKALGVSVSSTLTFSNPLVIPTFQNSYGQGNNPYFFEFVDGSNGAGDGVDESWGPALDRGYSFMQVSSFILNPSNPQPQPWVSHPDNVKNFFDTGLSFDNNVSLSAGDEFGSFRLGLGYAKEKGFIPFTDFSKINGSIDASRKFGKNITANVGFKYTKSSSDNLPSGGYDGANVLQQTIWSARQVDLEQLRDFNNLPLAGENAVFGAGIVPINWMTRFQNNPFWQLATNKNAFNRDRILGQGSLSSKFWNDFTITGTLAIDNYNTLMNSNLAKGSAADAPSYARVGGNRSGAEGYFDEDRRTFFESNASFLLNYMKDLNEDFDISLNVGANQMFRKTSSNFNAIQIGLPGVYSLTNILAGSTRIITNTRTKQGISSVYATGDISFRDYLFLNFTARNDWTSVLARDNMSFFYPSVNMSAILSDALGFKSDYINYLKVRGSWAKVGGFGPLGASSIIKTYNLSSSPWDGLAFGYLPTRLYNPDVKTQTTTGIEFGLDANLFKNKVRLGVTYYDQKNEDLVLPIQVSAATGYTSIWDNAGELRNKGVEVQLGSTLFKNDDRNFKVDLDLNFAKNNNMVVSTGESDVLVLGGQWEMDLAAKKDYPFGVIMGPSLARDSSGQVIYQNGLPVVGETKVLGDIQPDWTGGANLAISYKNFKFSGLVDAKMGGDVYSMTNAWGRYSGVLAETLLGREGGIVGNGVMNIGTDANPQYVQNNVVVSAEQFNKNTYGNTIVETSVFDASYVKLRQITLGYTIPNKLLNNTGLDGIELGVTGRNLAILFKNAPHIDPETGFSNDIAQQGQEFAQLPSARTFSFNINLKF